MIVITQNIDISFKLPEIRLLIGFAAKLLVFSCSFTNKMMKFVGKKETSETVKVSNVFL